MLNGTRIDKVMFNVQWYKRLHNGRLREGSEGVRITCRRAVTTATTTTKMNNEINKNGSSDVLQSNIMIQNRI